ncbi:putative disease resistance RPP13-like protein 3 [Salvia splendens]|uniref:putative disease resistance RPP13-like protein 3 n=1 Tax=Salvia splendens TaxID=180675 RepID=UPI001101359A|nr:putative disease resistance RPP13-like protein 3 [Salvia splendens]
MCKQGQDGRFIRSADCELKEELVRVWHRNVKFLSVAGMAGIGKTTLARTIYEDFDMVEWFECRAWVEVGREWQLHNIMRNILDQVKSHQMMLTMEDDDDDERGSEYLRERLKGKRFLIVLDDVWDAQVCHDIKKLAATIEYLVGSRVLLITRMQGVVERAGL